MTLRSPLSLALLALGLASTPAAASGRTTGIVFSDLVASGRTTGIVFDALEAHADFVAPGHDVIPSDVYPGEVFDPGAWLREHARVAVGGDGAALTLLHGELQHAALTLGEAQLVELTTAMTDAATDEGILSALAAQPGAEALYFGTLYTILLPLYDSTRHTDAGLGDWLLAHRDQVTLPGPVLFLYANGGVHMVRLGGNLDPELTLDALLDAGDCSFFEMVTLGVDPKLRAPTCAR